MKMHHIVSRTSVLVALFSVLSVSLILIGYFYIQHQNQSLEDQIEKELTGVADLKATQIALWRNDRVDDATLIFGNDERARNVEDAIHHSRSSEQWNILVRWMERLCKHGSYESVFLFDPEGKLLASVPSSDASQLDVDPSNIRSVARSKSILFSDLHSGRDTTIFMNMLVPVLIRSKDGTACIAVVVLHTNAEKFLYPFLQYWPTKSRTAETLIIRKNKDSVLFLSNLRHAEKAALSKTIPLTEKDVPAVQAVLGTTGTLRGNDYRGVPVLAAIKSIPNSPWFLVAKIDREEYLAPLRQMEWLIGISIFVLIGAAGVIVIMMRRNEVSAFEKMEYELELERLVLREHYNDFIKYSNDIFLLYNENLDIVEANDRAAESYGFSRDELLGMNIKKIFAPEAVKDIEGHKLSTNEENGSKFESLHRKKNGAFFPVELSSRSVLIEGKTYHQSIVRDISERKENERKILRFIRIRVILGNINQLIVRVRDKNILLSEACRIAVEDGKFRAAWIALRHREIEKPEIAAYFGCTGEQMRSIWGIKEKSKTSFFFMPFEDGKPAICNDIASCTEPAEWREEATKAGYRSYAALPLVIKERTIGTLNLCADEIMTFDKEEVNVLKELVADISYALEFLEQEEERTKQTKLKWEREREFRYIYQNSPIGIALFNTAGDLVEANNACLEILGLPENYTTEVNIFRHFNLPYPRQAALQDGEFVREELSLDFSIMKERQNFPTVKKGLYYFDFSITPIKSEQKIVNISYLVHIRDVTEARSAEQSLRESAERFRLLTMATSDAVYDWDVTRNLLWRSKFFREMLNAPRLEIVEPNWRAINIHPNDKDRIATGFSEALQSSVSKWENEYRMKLASGEYCFVVDSAYFVRNAEGKVVRVIGAVSDVTAQKKAEGERKNLQQQLFQAQKMESMGTLAGGIAHDFNNILGIILGYSTLLERGNVDPETLSSSVGQITKAVRRGAGLVRQILTFARKTEARMEAVNVNFMLEELFKMLSETFPKTISLSRHFEKMLPIIVVDPSQLHQAVLNLCVNARDAMNGNGALTVTTSMIDKEQIAGRFPTAMEKHYIVITVADTGTGMDEKTKSLIFEPFFTTKEQGKGTGLGLAVVYGVMQTHNGFIDLESEPGRGTKFYLYLPVKEEMVSPLKDDEAHLEPLRGGNETILVVEDEEMLREMVKNELTRRGYMVLTAIDGTSAVDTFKKHFASIGLVFCDMGLPKLGGWEAYLAMKGINPSVKVLASSGYVEPGFLGEMKKGGIKGFIPKPYKMDNLLRQIRTVLDGK
jgi:PAS domain S-box-containing protein